MENKTYSEDDLRAAIIKAIAQCTIVNGKIHYDLKHTENIISSIEQPLPSLGKEITAEEFIREKIRKQIGITGEMQGLQRYSVNGEDCLRWAHEYASQFQPSQLTPSEEEVTLIKEIWQLWENMAEVGELSIGKNFSNNYDKLKRQVDKWLQAYEGRKE